MLCLFETTQTRISYNFDMYEESFVPKKLPGGGGFSIKNMSLYSLYQEHTMGHNIFTCSNRDYPLMRYIGCSIKLYQSEDIDYVCTYSNTWPLISNMAMYNTMQPSLHLMLKNKIIVPSKRTRPKRKPYIKKFIPPPTQMKNQWYFQQKLSRIPLYMIRTSAISLDHYYIGSRDRSTNITITTLNYSYIQNRNWGNRNVQYYARTLGTQILYLYGTTSEQTDFKKIKLQELVPLTNTQDYTKGYTYEEYKQRVNHTANYDTYFKDIKSRGNPFYPDYLKGDIRVFTTPTLWSTINEKQKTNDTTNTIESLGQNELSWTEITLTIETRYNPYKDNGSHNKSYFLPVKQAQHGWDAPGRQELENYNLPLWILLFGFSDFVKKTEIIHNVDTEHILVLNTTKTNPPKDTLIPLSESFIEGHSPYETEFNEEDRNRWYPCYQYQQEITNEICLCGPGTPKIPPTNTVEAKMKYTFHFKWGGDPPPMSIPADPTEQPWYPIPNNNTQTTSLQNPETAPETFLYTFDERRGQLTETATKRMQKDWETKETSFLPTEPRFSEKTTTQAQIQETSSEEEEDNLFELLNQQRLKQQRLKHRITQTLKKIQKLE